MTTTVTGDVHVPMASAAADLRCLLSDRFQQTAPYRDPALPLPSVAVLGVHDVLDVAIDPHACMHPGATVHLTPSGVLVGPWGQGQACGRCLAMRWQRVQAEFRRSALEYGEGTFAVGSWPVMTGYLADAVWSLYQESAWKHRRSALSMVAELNPLTLGVRGFPLLADPLCPSCRPDEGELVAGEVVLSPAAKPAPDQYRRRGPEDYPLLVETLVNPITGLLGPLANKHLTTPTMAPVFGSILMHGEAGLTDMTWCGQANTYRRSQRIGLLEGLERYAGTRRRSRSKPVVASYQELGADAVDPRDCGLYTAATYENDGRLRPFDPRRSMHWIWGYSLRDLRPVLVPSRIVYYGARRADDDFVFECSNGCASGGSLTEAVLFGLLELIERDAFLLAWYGGVQLPEIDLGSWHSPALRTMLDRADLAGYDVRAFDTRIDIDVPVATALAVRRDGGDGALSFAAAASLDPATAARDAIAEVLTYIPELPARVERRRSALTAMAANFDLVEELNDHATLFALPKMSSYAEAYLEPRRPRSAAQLYRGWPDRYPRSSDLLDDVDYCVGQLADAGFDVIVVDQTAPEQRPWGLHTVSTIAPGLLPIDFGWRRQRALHMPRMFSAFHRAGWRSTDLTPAELHLVPHPFP